MKRFWVVLALTTAASPAMAGGISQRTAAPALPSTSQPGTGHQVAFINGWTIFDERDHCSAFTSYEHDLALAIYYDHASHSVDVFVLSPAWESVRDGQSYPNVTVHFSNGSDYPDTGAEGIHRTQPGGHVTVGLRMGLNADDFLRDVAASASLTVNVGSMTATTLSLRGSRVAMTRLISCSAQAFRSHPPDPFRYIPSPARPAVPVQPSAVSGAEARANLASYISDSDYPAAAIRAEQQGTVGFHLAVGTDGRVTSCTITSSSGASVLDETTCRIMRSRARFTPARDDHGNPTMGSADGRIRWVLPVYTPPPPPPQ